MDGAMDLLPEIASEADPGISLEPGGFQDVNPKSPVASHPERMSRVGQLRPVVALYLEIKQTLIGRGLTVKSNRPDWDREIIQVLRPHEAVRQKRSRVIPDGPDCWVGAWGSWRGMKIETRGDLLTPDQRELCGRGMVTRVRSVEDALQVVSEMREEALLSRSWQEQDPRIEGLRREHRRVWRMRRRAG